MNRSDNFFDKLFIHARTFRTLDKAGYDLRITARLQNGYIPTAFVAAYLARNLHTSRKQIEQSGIYRIYLRAETPTDRVSRQASAA